MPTTAKRSKAKLIDDYFRDVNGYPQVPYKPIGRMVVDEVEKQGENGLYLSTACALIEQESMGKNIFGCDWGQKWTNVAPYCNVAVTEQRVEALIRNVEQGGGQNGVGLTQLTTIDLVEAAEQLGGAHVPRFQCRIGFKYLLQLVNQLGWPAGAAAYNAGAGNWRSVINTYGAEMTRKQIKWERYLSQAGEADEKPDGGPDPGGGSTTDSPGRKEWNAAIKYLTPAIDRTPYWVWKSGIIPNGPGAWSENKKAPLTSQVIGEPGIFCFPGDTRVEARGIRRSYKRFYSGEVITIETAGGNKLTGTPNHPVLTDKGWVALKDLRKGCYVISATSAGKLSRLDPHDYEQPTRFEQMHSSLAHSGYVQRDVVGPLDFHGDGVDGVEGEVDVVIPERVLRDGREPAILQESKHFGFADSALADPCLAGPHGPNEETAGIGLLAGFVGGTDLREPTLGAKACVLQSLGFGDSPQTDTGLLEATNNNGMIGVAPVPNSSWILPTFVLPDDGRDVEVEPVGGVAPIYAPPAQSGAFLDTPQCDAGLLEPLGDHPDAHAEAPRDLRCREPLPNVGGDEVLGANVGPRRWRWRPDASEDRHLAPGSEGNAGLAEPAAHRPHPDVEAPRDLAYALAREVSRDEVVRVDVRVFEGHVYNLETENGAYLANGIIAHNCAGVANLLLRRIGKKVPTLGYPAYDGAVSSYFGGAFGPSYYEKRGHSRKFNLAEAKAMANNSGIGVLVGREYSGPALADQGHVAICLPKYKDGKNYCLQSIGGYAKWPGMNWIYTIEQSHAGWYYTKMIAPRYWFSYRGDEF